MSYPPPTAPLRAVVFDLDGLIVNTEDLYDRSGREVLRRRGLQMTDSLREQMTGRKAQEAIRLMIDTLNLPDTVEALLAETTDVFQEFTETLLQTMPGLDELLNHLQAVNTPAAVATSGSRDYAADMLARFDLVRHFRFVLSADDVARGKPHPEVYELAARQLGFSTSELMVLEDSANGCRAAVAAGAYTVAVPNRHTAGHPFPAVAFRADTLADMRIRAALGNS